MPGTGLPAGAPHVAIVGGGASGVLMAAHLLRSDPALTVTLIEKGGLLGCGLAYSTRDRTHLLNTRVANMSAFPDDPGHLRDWLAAQGIAAGEADFIDRPTYGRYMADLLGGWRGGGRLTCRQDEVEGLSLAPDGVTLRLAGGGEIAADRAVLATGHALPQPGPDSPLSDPWTSPVPESADARVILIGSGLTMVDQVLSLLAAGHRGEIVAVSRRGLLPRPHAAVAALPIPAAEVPFGAPLSRLLLWLRRRTRSREAAGGDWREVVDGLRPHVQALWQAMDGGQRRRFLRHGATWWEVHRHRLPPSSAAALAAAMGRGQLRLLKGAFLGARRDPDGTPAAGIRPAGGRAADWLRGARILDCRGIRRDPRAHAGPLIGGLLAAGLARLDPQGLGLDVDRACRLIGADGRPEDRLLAIGPVSRAAFWEITAIPDIRVQTSALARTLALRTARPQATA